MDALAGPGVRNGAGVTALAVQRHRCGTACWAAGCAIGGIPSPEPPREQRSLAEARGEDATNGGRQVTAQPRRRAAHELAFRAQVALAYDAVMRRYFWRTWGGHKAGPVPFSPWDRAVVWRRLETGASAADLAEHFGVETKTVQRILRRHEDAAGWRR